MSTAHPLWIIGVDGLDPDLMAAWVAAGELPTIARCMEQGVFGPLRSTYNELTSSAWATVATGANPGAHGIYNFQERVPGQYRLYLPNSTHRALPAFWDLAGAEGRRVVVARVPMTFPVQPVNGLAVADWLAPAPSSPGFTYPEQLGRKLVRRFGHAFWGDPIGDQEICGFDAHRKLLRTLLIRVDKAFDLFRYLLTLEDPDLLFVYLQDTDVAGHAFWPYHDTDGPGYDPETPPDLQNALLGVYRRVDQALGRLLARHQFEGNLMIISDHGMGRNTMGPHCVGPLLEAAGLMVGHQGAAQSPGMLRRARRAIVRHIPWSIRRRLKPITAATRDRGFTEQMLTHIDFARSRAFSFGGLQVGEIWLNLRGRDPEGTVAPGAEAEELTDCITRLFLEARDPETGVCPVEEVKRREELFTGGHLDALPDLLVRFRAGVPVNGLTATLDDGSEVTVRPPGDEAAAWSAHHRPCGTLVACGPDIAADAKPVHGDLMDIAPTALTLLDAAIPSYVEGVVLEAMLRESASSRRADYELPLERANPVSYTASELARVGKRLRGLGYI